MRQSIQSKLTAFEEGEELEPTPERLQEKLQGFAMSALSEIEHAILFGLLETILVVLSLMLIMQGTVNVKE